MIKRFINFINWENFTRPMFYANWIGSLLLFLLFIFLLLLVSKLVINKKNLFKNSTEEFVLRSFLGLSLFSFFLIFLGFLGALNAIVVGTLLVISCLYLFVRSKNSYAESFFILTDTLKSNKWIWILAFFMSLPALLPPLWTDEVHFHMVYPFQWVNKQHIFTDTGMRFPLYTFNFQILFCLGFFLKSTTFCHLLTWFCGVLVMLGIISFSNHFNVWKPISILGALAFILTPVVQQHLTVSYIDVQLNAFLFASVYSLVLLSKNSEEKEYQIFAGIICAMFLGMKISNAVFAPIFILIAIWLCGVKNLKYFLLIFICLGSIWYVRNLVIAGDPIPPAINFAIGKADKYWTLEDYKFQMADLQKTTGWGWKTIYKLPIELIHPSADSPVRYWGILGYVLLFPFSLFLLFKKKKELTATIAICFFAFLLWLSMSFFTRYMHFLALAALLSVILINELYCRYLSLWNTSKWRNLSLIVLFSVIFIGPTFSGISTLKNSFSKKVPLNSQEESEFVGWFSPPYLNPLISDFEKYGIKKGETVYGYGTLMNKYYFFRNGYRMVGDGLGKYKYKIINQEINKNSLAEYLKNEKISALVIDKEYVNDSILLKKLDKNKNILKLYEDKRYKLLRSE